MNNGSFQTKRQLVGQCPDGKPVSWMQAGILGEKTTLRNFGKSETGRCVGLAICICKECELCFVFVIFRQSRPTLSNLLYPGARVQAASLLMTHPRNS